MNEAPAGGTARGFRVQTGTVSGNSATVDDARKPFVPVRGHARLIRPTPSPHFPPRSFNVRGQVVHFSPTHVELDRHRVAYVVEPELFRYLVALGGRVFGRDQHGFRWPWPEELGGFPA